MDCFVALLLAMTKTQNAGPHPEEPRKRRLEGRVAPLGPHGSQGDAKHRPETREDALLTMRSV
jgi:hypothetical protein